MRKALFSIVALLICISLAGFKGQAYINFEGSVIDSYTGYGVGDVQVTLWDMFINKRYDTRTDDEGKWSVEFEIDGVIFENKYGLGNIEWKIEYKKAGMVFSNSSVSRSTLEDTYVKSYILNISARKYKISAYVEAKSTSNQAYPSSSSVPAISFRFPGSTSVQLDMELIRAGTFAMGSPSWETDRYSDEGPQHQVTISQSIYMGIYEVTQAQWAAVMGTYPSRFGYIPDNPVEQVSWEDCQKFITKLNTMGIGTFRLPTEAEWEYACRAGSTTRFPWGEDSNYVQTGQYAWYYDNSGSRTNPVGQKKANSWGLYDMHGNVGEWCSDWFGSYSADAQTDPKGAASGSYRVVRGGAWDSSQRGCRPSYRFCNTPSLAFGNVGFRLVRVI